MLPVFVGTLFVVGLLYFLTLRLDNSKYYAYVNKYNLQAKNEKLAKLINSEGLENLPSLLIDHNSSYVRQHEDLSKVSQCAAEPLFVAPLDPKDKTTLLQYNSYCTSRCGSLGRMVVVSPSQEFYHINKRLPPGKYCMVDNQVKCNPRTGYVVADGLGSWVCRSKYPNLFGGTDASKVIACNNELHPSTGSILWDNLLNAPVNAATVTLDDENELVPGTGTYRFTCKFNNTTNNRVLPHPANRFHPINDPCTREVPNAHSDARVVFDHDDRGVAVDWHCDCGDPKVTRLYNSDATDNKSTCTPCVNRTTQTDRKLDISVHFKCFNLSSMVTDLFKTVPCKWSDFLSNGTSCNYLELELYETRNFMTPFDIKYTKVDGVLLN
nr:per-os infectivity factor 2 [Heliothis virescens nudivirus]